MTIRIFKCGVCGNVDVETVNGGGVRSCCGKPMIQLNANSTEAATEKHIPVIQRNGDQVQDSVSTVAHPMTKEHWINFIVLVQGSGFQVCSLTPEDEPVAVFTVKGNEPVTAYEYCNLHGLWMAEE